MAGRLGRESRLGGTACGPELGLEPAQWILLSWASDKTRGRARGSFRKQASLGSWRLPSTALFSSPPNLTEVKREPPVPSPNVGYTQSGVGTSVGVPAWKGSVECFQTLF